MTELAPNRAQLILALPPKSDAAALVERFEGDDLEVIRSALRKLVDSWEQQSTSSET